MQAYCPVFMNHGLERRPNSADMNEVLESSHYHHIRTVVIGVDFEGVQRCDRRLTDDSEGRDRGGRSRRKRRNGRLRQLRGRAVCCRRGNRADAAVTVRPRRHRGL